MRRWWIIGPLLLAAICFSCSSKSNNGGGGGGGGGDGTIDPGTDLDVGPKVLIDNSNVIVSSVSLAAAPNALWAVAYYKDTQSTTQCKNHITPATIGTTSIYYAISDGSSWTPELAASPDANNIITASISGISLVFDNNGIPFVAYTGGAISGQCCMAGDLEQSSRSAGGIWTAQSIVQNSAQAPNQDANCPVNQNYCTFGDTVGLWPSQALAPDGTIGIAYQDIHNCFNKDDTDRADAEIALQNGVSTNLEWIDIGRGGGYYNKLVFDSTGTPAATFYNGKNGSISFSKRGTTQWPWDSCTNTSQCQTGYTCDTTNSRCVIDVVKNVGGLPEGSLSLAIGQDGRYLLAYYNPTSMQLKLTRSDPDPTAGINWSSATLDSDGAAGMYPTILINPVTHKPVIVYYVCRADTNKSTCDYNQDGLRLAVFVGVYPDDLLNNRKWKKYNLDSALDKTGIDGKFVSAAIQSDGTIGVAYFYTSADGSQQALMFRTIKIK